MALCSPSHLLSLSCVACFYFLHTYLHFYSDIQYLRLMSLEMRSDRRLPRYDWRTGSESAIGASTQYLIIWLLGNCIFWPLKLAAIHNPVLVFYLFSVSCFSFPFFSVLGWTGRMDTRPILVFLYHNVPWWDFSFLDRIPIQIYSIQTDSCDLYLALMYQLKQRLMGTLASSNFITDEKWVPGAVSNHDYTKALWDESHSLMLERDAHITRKGFDVSFIKFYFKIKHIVSE